MRLRSNFNPALTASFVALAASGCSLVGDEDPTLAGVDADVRRSDAGTQSPPGSGDTAGEAGATPGGVQDMGLARELVEEGLVPPPEAFVVEGMFSEHDLPVKGPSCEDTLCLRSALAVAPTVAGEPSAWLQVGMSSDIDLGTYERPSTTLIATVDVSGSMGWDYGEDDESETPAQVSHELLSQIAETMRPDDRVAIVTYGSEVDTPLPPTSGDDQEAIHAAIEGLDEGGVTNMEAGLRRAYELAAEVDADTAETRVMLFTDVRPNVDATEATEFETITAEGADQGVGLTLFGLGLGLRQELLDAMSHLRGGNAFSLFDSSDVDELMEKDWPFLVAPIAYNLAQELEAPEGLALAEGYGFPDGEGEARTSLEVSSVFLSRRRGAVLVRLSPTDEQIPETFSITGDLSYEERSGELREQSVQSNLSEEETFTERGHYYGQQGVGDAVGLALFVSSMKRAAEHYADDPDTAIEEAEAARDRLHEDAEARQSEALESERSFADAIVKLMQEGAEQGDLYPR